ncbi:MAG: aminotransferase DegT [Eubacterium sp.]|jgi:Predicted pyridoxal phosphate-dependent enzyme apparently involved in regulation of cell wall biogenesis|nr:aminotransferase DegT [Eubacterium sp.]
MDKPRIFMSSPTMHGEEMQFIQEAFDENWISPLGPNVENFEKELAEYAGCGSALALSSGTAALHLAVKLLGIKKDDIVICSSFTFAATCNPVAYEGGRLVFVDSEEDTWNMSPQALRKALEKYPQARAVIYVHLYGTPAKTDEILTICREYDVPVIEDAAESLGAKYKGKATGNFGLYSAYSFNGNKIITTSGGGALLSGNKEKIDYARYLSTQAREPKLYYEHKAIGYNYRMSNITAGIGRGQLLHLDEHIEAKKNIYDTYREAFKDLPVHMNPYEEGIAEPNFWLSCITIDENCRVRPDAIIEALTEENIESRPLWNPMHRQPVFAGCDFVKAVPEGETSVSDRIFESGMCLPSDVKNTPEDMEKIIRIIRKMF